MGKITLILGGARSGKSSFAAELAERSQKGVVFIATGEALDTEMHRRIARHKSTRPKHWRTIEESRDLAKAIKKVNNVSDCIIIDCLTLLVSNLILARESQEQIENKICVMLGALKRRKGKALIVSNEVGLGIVPLNPLARKFRDIAGRVNQLVAAKSDEVYFLVSGIPAKIKGARRE